MEVLGLYSKTKVGNCVTEYNLLPQCLVCILYYNELTTVHIPHSEVFNDGFRKKVIDGRMIKSLCLFRVRKYFCIHYYIYILLFQMFLLVIEKHQAWVGRPSQCWRVWIPRHENSDQGKRRPIMGKRGLCSDRFVY